MGQVEQIGVSETMKQKNEEYQPPGNLLGTPISESDGRTLCTCMLLWNRNEPSHNDITMVVKKPSQVLKQIRFLVLLKNLETLSPFGGVS